MRHFRQNLSRYMEVMKSGEILVVDGYEYAKVGKVGGTPGVKREKRAVVKEEPVYQEESMKECELCGKDCCGVWVFWEEGSEREVCADCVMRSCGSEKMYKIITKGYRWRE